SALRPRNEHARVRSAHTLQRTAAVEHTASRAYRSVASVGIALQACTLREAGQSARRAVSQRCQLHTWYENTSATLPSQEVHGAASGATDWGRAWQTCLFLSQTRTCVAGKSHPRTQPRTASRSEGKR